MEPDANNKAAEAKEDEALFRREALDYYLSESDEGQLLRVSPRWANWTYRVLVIITLTSVMYLALGSAPVYETGPALIRIENVTLLSAPGDGTIETVGILPGQEVAVGDVLVQFRAESESAQFDRVRTEFELQLLARLRDPNDSDAERELRRLRPELERAKVSLEQTRIVAPRPGTVQDVRIRPGDFLAAGQPVLTLTPTNPKYTVIAFLAGHALPQLTRGRRVRLIVEGYAYAELETSIDSIGSKVIGPSEGRRFLGPEIGDTLTIDGPVVVVRCTLDRDHFSTAGRAYRIHDGMKGTAEIEVRRERLFFRLIPALKVLGNGSA